MKKVLLALGSYYILFGLLAVVFSSTYFTLLNSQAGHHQIWICIALFSCLLGLGYLISHKNPLGNWSIIAVGFLAKTIGAAIWFFAFANNAVSLQSIWMPLLNSLLWLPPLIGILHIVYNRSYFDDKAMMEILAYDESITLKDFETNEGESLSNLTHKSPTLIVFLRHFGCTFCREALKDLAIKRNKIEIKGTRIALVHMVDNDVATKELKKYGLSDIPHISDPENILYKKFRLSRGSIGQLLGIKVLFRAFLGGAISKHGIGSELGNSFQMPGIFLMHKDEVLKSYIHKSAADRPNYEDLALCRM